ncbi:unnamed protein product [Arabidopsis lyrata]|uniref:Uncharacterized protein n=4 Tax=Arabidopsis TaxID=3701 RepID=D7KP05_ARALL|nr:defensin-like protein 90 [Arabidopsis lyrata subsp. lyrata]EFH68157.1 hypothetical protein ARALYDRAFT_892684 [Arabidopsis lyrata subsp. lyrata]KAG7585611.1 hypothetical protein ISN45_Aa02g009550 [Arabidopsis thaliana x Arabidopsis arenosa]KAG7588654.1 hypothetical protein ISN44_As07g009730 [Arabidopsis suecica]CAH8256805.1 unnamed protein product [Arabidopsis lyrata]|eukprot:XP_002891897.2 defensin-like protein 90 [Arabidopsis lyrata subsp. lyrata]
MTTKIFSYVLLHSLMMFALILSSMGSPGKYYDCKQDGCITTPPCWRKCLSMGYPKGGECRTYSYGGVCCCELSSKPPN